MSIVIAVEGESDRAILKEMLNKLNLNKSDYDIRLPPARSGGKENLYRKMSKMVQSVDCENIIFLVDSDNSKKDEEKFKKKVDELQNQNPNMKIHLCFAKPEIEAWLLGCFAEIVKDLENEECDNAENPVSLIENFMKKKNKDYTYHKVAEGKKIAKGNELKHFECSKSFKEFENIIKLSLNL